MTGSFLACDFGPDPDPFGEDKRLREAILIHAVLKVEEEVRKACYSDKLHTMLQELKQLIVDT